MPLSDDVVYCLILAISLPIAHFVKLSKDAEVKRMICTVAGFLFVCSTCCYHIYHSLITAVGSIIIIKAIGPRKCYWYLYVWSFGYLLFFRTCHFLGLPQPPPLSNAVQLLLTLRIVSLGFEMYDTYNSSKKEDLSEGDLLKKKYSAVNPSSLDILCYFYCFLGQFTGPFYKFRTYQDMLNNNDSASIPTLEPVLKRLKPVPFVLVSFLVFSHFFSIQYVAEDEFYEHPFWYRLLYMVPMFIIFRSRMYIAWLVSECMAMASTLGAYPAETEPKCGSGPTNFLALEQINKKKDKTEVQYSFETIRNLDIYGCELAPRVREGLRSWNMTVQYWLASFVHKRVPNHLRAYGVAITMAVSAFWHGVHPGYYLSFGLVPILVAAEDKMVKLFRREGEKSTTFDWINWFLKMRGFDYMCMGFLLLKLDLTLSYWKSIFFLGHIIGAIFLILGYSLSTKPKKEFIQKKEKSS